MTGKLQATHVPLELSDRLSRPLSDAITYTMQPMYTEEGYAPIEYYEWRIFMLAAIEQARLDVVVGITDSSVSEGQRSKRRADALMFFIDGRYDNRLEFCGMKIKADPIGIPEWIMAIAQWARNMPGCSPVAKDNEAVMWAYDAGHLDKAQTWQDAGRASGNVKKAARRLLVAHLDSGKDEYGN